VLLDGTPSTGPLGDDDWQPHRAPSPARILGRAVRSSLTDPETAVATIRTLRRDLMRRSTKALSGLRDGADMIVGGGQEAPGPLDGPVSQQRWIVTVETSLADYRRVRATHGGTINDVILTVVAGALRSWLMTRPQGFSRLKSLRALVPVSVIDDESLPTSLGSQIAAHFVDLPVGEPAAVVRLHQVSYSFESHKASGRSVGARRLANIAGFAPITFHAVGARVAGSLVGSPYALSIVNVPGPQSPLYAGSARMVASYPVHPLLPGHGIAIGATSYDGKVFFGVTIDRDLTTDPAVFGQCLTEALDELVDLAGGRQRAPRGRRAKAAPPSDGS
jgi:diacylglycerol O-acyltransferase